MNLNHLIFLYLLPAYLCYHAKHKDATADSASPRNPQNIIVMIDKTRVFFLFFFKRHT